MSPAAPSTLSEGRRAPAGRGRSGRIRWGGLRGLFGNTRGAAAIELAIGMVPLVTLVTGGITYGGVLAAMMDINQAAGEGARAAIAGVTLCERQTIGETRARNALMFQSFATAADIDVSVTASVVRVDIALPYSANALTPILFPIPETLTASVIANTDGPEFPATGC